MKLAVQQLESQLAKNLAPIYIVSSDELLLTQETIDQIHRAAQASGFNERIRITAEANSDWQQLLYSHVYSISLFSAKQLIELNCHHVKFNAGMIKILQEFAEKPAENTVLIIRTNK